MTSCTRVDPSQLRDLCQIHARDSGALHSRLHAPDSATYGLGSGSTVGPPLGRHRGLKILSMSIKQ
eukprot:865848-Prymnesium_polylepis.1